MSIEVSQKEETRFDVDGVINRLLQFYGAKNDTDYATMRHLARSTVGNWRKRKSIPYSECEFMFLEYGASMDWLLNGEGSQYRSQPIQVVNYGRESNVVTTGVNNGHIVAEVGIQQYNTELGGRGQRICNWVRDYVASHSSEDVGHFEERLRRAFPEFESFKG